MPALAAAQQSLAGDPAAAASAAVGCALAYPGGILGVIFVILILKAIFRKELGTELAAAHAAHPVFINASVALENKALDGLMIKDVPALKGSGVAISRVYRGGRLSIAHDDTVLRAGDVVLAVGLEPDVRRFTLAAGSPSQVDLKKVPSKIIHTRVLVTHKDVIGRGLEELGLEKRYDVTATRVARSGVEFLVPDGYVLQFADDLVVVGEEEAVAEVARLLGNSPKDLDRPRLIPVLIGIVLGVALGSLPIRLPGLSGPIRLGLAGGPMIMAILLSRARAIGPLNWYMPPAASLLLRELGIVLFLTCVGLDTGGAFVNTIAHGNGITLMLLSALITVLPALAAAYAFKRRYGFNFMALCGALTGSTTNPPALAFAGSLAPSSLHTMAYATVYPLAMILRIVSAQLIPLFFMK
jgi:putative transport protein